MDKGTGNKGTGNKGTGNKGTGRWLLLLPITLIAYIARRWFTKPKTAEEIRADDKAHQSSVRRELRGLSPEHDQTAERERHEQP